MSGLSTRGLADGFVRGFSVMDNYFSNQQRRDQSEKTFDRQQSELDREDAARVTQAMYEGVMSGNIDPEIAKQFEAKTGHVRWTDYIDPEFGRSLATMNDVLSGKADVNTPEGIAAVNRLYDQEIKRGVGEQVGNKKIVDKMVNRVIPTKDGKGFMLNLAVKEEDESGGWSVRNAPVTGPNRSATDQEVKQIDLEQALSDLKGKMMVYQAIQSSPKLADFIRQRAAKLGAKLPEAEKQWGERQFDKNLGWIQDAPDGKTHVLKGLKDVEPRVINNQLVPGDAYGDYRDAPENKVFSNGLTLSPDGTKVLADNRVNGGKGGGSDPAVIKEAQWLIDNGIAKSPEEAYNKVQQASFDPIRYVADEKARVMKYQEENFITPKDENGNDNPNYRTPKQIADDAIEEILLIRQRINDPKQQSAQSQEGQQAGLQTVASPKQDKPKASRGLIVGEGKVDRSSPAPQPAPKEAINYLRNNPYLRNEFLNKYKYLPEGF